MAAARADFIIDQGEDWTVQILWSDFFDNPMAITAPMRMTIKSLYGGIVHELVIPSSPPPSGTVAEISYNTESGLIQLHMDSSVTGALTPGIYNYDLFCSVDDGGTYAGSQVQRLLYGTVTIQLRYSTAL